MIKVWQKIVEGHITHYSLGKNKGNVFIGSRVFCYNITKDTITISKPLERQSSARRPANPKAIKLTEDRANKWEDEMRRLENDTTVSKEELRLFMQTQMECGHAVGNLLTCSDPPWGCVICNLQKVSIYYRCESCGLIIEEVPSFKEGECPGQLQHNFVEIIDSGKE